MNQNPLRSGMALLLVSVAACATPLRQAMTMAPPPAPSSSAPLEVCWLETGGKDGWGGLGTAGHTRAPIWHASASALLIRHPKGDLLVDAGLSPAIASELA